MTPSHIAGSILGTAVGDAIGLPYEGLSRRRGLRLLGEPDRHRLVFGRGMVSDDTEHACMVAQALIASGGDVRAFQRSLAWRLRFWLLGLPAGTGLATLRAILRLWVGFGPNRSGVFSAGNGPAMRAAVLGVAVADVLLLQRLNRVSTRVTHTDPKAEHGALAVALAARLASQQEELSAAQYLSLVTSVFGAQGQELLALLSAAVASAERGESTEQFAGRLGLSEGVSGYVFHSVPIAIHAWLVHPRDFRAAITAVVRCGGDTDSTAAIVGGIVGAAVRKESLPPEWLGGLLEWPRTISWMERLGAQLETTARTGIADRPARLPILGLLLRNVVFLLVVLYHGFRRMFPPY